MPKFKINAEILTRTVLSVEASTEEEAFALYNGKVAVLQEDLVRDLQEWSLSLEPVKE